MKLSKYELRVRQLETEGMTRSDVQAVADAEEMQEYRALHKRWQENFVKPGKTALSAAEWHRMIALEKAITQ